MEVSMENDLSDNQRRFICRMVFMFVCALPTLLVTYFATHQRSADHWAKLIQAELGVTTTIGAVETPRPGELILKDLKFLDENREPVFESLKTKIIFGNTNRIEVQNPVSMTRENMGYVLNEVAGCLLKLRPEYGTDDAKPWALTFRNIEILEPSNLARTSQAFRSEYVRIEVGNGIDGPDINFEATEWGEARLVRNYNENRELQFKLDTKEGARIPCWLVKSWFPVLELELGPNASFSGGAFVHTLGKRSQSCTVHGNFYNVSLPNLRGVSPRLVQRINVDNVKLSDSLWIEGNAWIVFNDLRTERIRRPTRGEQPIETFTPIRQNIREALLDRPSPSSAQAGLY